METAPETVRPGAATWIGLIRIDCLRMLPLPILLGRAAKPALKGPAEIARIVETEDKGDLGYRHRRGIDIALRGFFLQLLQQFAKRSPFFVQLALQRTLAEL